MEKPEKCPECNAPYYNCDPEGLHYKCGTVITVKFINRTHKCKDRQIATLQRRNEKLERVRELSSEIDKYLDFEAGVESNDRFPLNPQPLNITFKNMADALAALEEKEEANETV